ncbi:MAG: DUF3575 domain-containing protein [Ferruginibacter sp.]
MNRSVLTIIILFYFLTAESQEVNTWHISFNPLNLAEPQVSIGTGFEYRFLNRFGLWSEVSVILFNSYLNKEWSKLNGFRFIFQPRYYTGDARSFFITPELRLKGFNYHTTGNFINPAIADTLNLNYKASQMLIGGAIVFGKKINLSANKKLVLEITAGIGAKHRSIKRKDIPAGYTYLFLENAFGLAPHTNYDNDGTPYFPAGLRLFWQLK